MNDPSAAQDVERGSEMKYEYPFFTKNDAISNPMLSLGSLPNEPSIAERVQQSLETCAGNLSLEHGPNKLKGSIYTNQVAIGRNQNLRLICNLPPSVKDRKGLPQNIVNFGLKRIRVSFHTIVAKHYSLLRCSSSHDFAFFF